MPAGIEALTQGPGDFNSISILITLMILALLEKDSDEEGNSSSALGFLAGLALAAQIGQAFGDQGGAGVPEVGGSGGLGGQLDVST